MNLIIGIGRVKAKRNFANMFTLECFNDTEALGFVKETLPDIYNTYISMTAKNLGGI